MRRLLGTLFGALFAATVPAGAMEPPAPFVFPHVTSDPHPLRILGPAGELFTFVKSCATTKNAYAMSTAVIPPGAGPIPHIHHYTDEWFYFPDGGITLEMGEHPYRNVNFIPGDNAPKDVMHFREAKAGDVFYGPRYFIHGFFNNTTATHHIVFVWAPDDGVVDYFSEVGQHVKDFKNVPPINEKNKELFASRAPKYGINQSTSYHQYVSNVDHGPMPMLDEHLAELTKLLTTTPAQAVPVHIPCHR